MLGEAFLAIDRPAFGRLEGYFALFAAVRTRRFCHFSGTEIAPASVSVVVHYNLSDKILIKIFCKEQRATQLYKGMFFSSTMKYLIIWQ